MKTERIHPFKDRLKLTEMLNLRLNGYSVYSLGYLYNCNRKSIEFQCNKYDVVPVDQVYRIERLVAKFFPQPEYNHVGRRRYIISLE